MRGNRLFKALDRWLGVPLVRLLGLLKGPCRAAPLGPGGRVLLVKQSALGDTLLLLPLVKALRGAVGAAGAVDLACTRVNLAAARDLAWLDRTWVLEPGRLLSRPWQAWALARALRGRRYDWAMDLDQWLRSSALLAVASGARGRVGFASPGQHKHAAFHAWVPNGRQAHEFEQFKAVAALAGLDPGAVEPYAGFLMREGLLGAGAAPRGQAPLVVLHPGAGGGRGWQREWPVERYAQLAVWLRTQGARIALSGAGPREAALCAAIEQGAGPADERCVDGGLASLVATLCRADLLVCGNTGVMHLAAGLGCPVLALHGPNPVDKWGPLGGPGKALSLAADLPCSPCLSLGFEFGCPARPCMESIRLEAVQAAAASLLERRA